MNPKLPLDGRIYTLTVGNTLADKAALSVAKFTYSVSATENIMS